MAKPKISLIAAIGNKRELGKDNKLLWHIPEDLARFKKLTSGHVVIMGRKTFESIGRPLLNRTNIMVTRKSNYIARGCIITHSIKEALQEAKKQASRKAASAALNRDLSLSKVSGSWVFIIGGAQLYQQTIDIADRLYLTIVQGSFDADAFFPDYSLFNKVISKQIHSSDNYTYTFLTLEKN